MPEEDVSLLDYFKVIVKRWKIVIYTALFIGFLAIVISYLVEPVYVSDAAIKLNLKGGVSEGLLSQAPSELLSLVGISAEEGIESEVEFLSSRKVLGGVVDKLGLLVDKKDLPVLENGKSAISEIKINEIVKPGEYEIKFIDNKGNFVLLTSSKHYIGSGKNKERFLAGGFDFIINFPAPEKGEKIKFEVYDRYKHIMKIANELLEIKSISSDMMSLKIRYNSPKLAQQILQQIIDEYIDSKYSIKYKALEETLALLGERISQVKSKKERLENEMVEYQKDKNTVYFGEDLSPLMDEVSSLMNLQAQAEIERTLYINYLDLLNKGEVTGEVLPIQVNIAGVTVDPHISALNTSIGRLKSELGALKGLYTDEHPLVKEKKREIQQTQLELTQTVIDTLHDKIKLYNTRINAVKTRFDQYIDTIPQEQVELARMYMKIKEYLSIYEVLKTTYEAKKLEALQERARYNVVTVVSPPSFIKKPESPKKKLNLLMGLIMGAGIGVILAFSSQFVDWDEYKEEHPNAFWLITLPDRVITYPLRMFRKLFIKR